MSIWNKILVGVIIVASVAMFVLAARVLKTHQYWRSLTVTLEDKLHAAEELGRELNGDKDGPNAPVGCRQLRVQVHKILVDRGRVWRNCSPGKPNIGGNGNAVSVSVTTDLPDPNGITPKTVLYVFEENRVQDGGSYLGEFSVVAVANKVLELQPTSLLSVDEQQRLQNSRGPWSLYEVMLIDQQEIFAQVPENELREMLPDGSEEEYLADRAPADPEAKKPGRMLRDYEVLFGAYHDQWAMRNGEMEAAKSDVGYLKAALADARQQVQFRENEKEELLKLRAEVFKERDDVAAHLAAVEDMLATVQAGIEKIIENNQALAGAIAKIQLDATRRIDEQTRKMAQARRGS